MTDLEQKREQCEVDIAALKKNLKKIEEQIREPKAGDRYKSSDGVYAFIVVKHGGTFWRVFYKSNLKNDLGRLWYLYTEGYTKIED